MARSKRKTTVQSLQRGLEILVAVAQADRALGITDLSRQFGLAKGSISRLVATLAEQSFLTRDPETAKYRLSSRVWELGIGAVSQLDVRGIARPVMEKLNAATRETVHLTVLTESDEMVFLDKLDSTRAVRPNVELGATLPPYCVANGKAMLAFLPQTRVDRVLRGKLRRFTNTTIVRKGELLAALDTVRRLGYAVNHGEYRADVSGLAAPICDHTGLAVAALGVSVPANRMTAELIGDLAPRLVASAQQISSALGEREGAAAARESERPPHVVRANRGIGLAPAPKRDRVRSSRRAP
ncbi:MAG: IclR family transcriptional regulator [Betaproteobacteria bacterium]|nr:IclR family transcriptional regulator [Betaproteobacteria bacterium]